MTQDQAERDAEIEQLRAQLAASEKDNKDLLEAIDGAIKDREYFHAQLDELATRYAERSAENIALKAQLGSTRT